MPIKPKLLVLSRSVPVFDRNSVFLRLTHMLEFLSAYFDITLLALNSHERYGFERDIYVEKLKELGIKFHIAKFDLNKILKDNFEFVLCQFYYVAKNFVYKLFEKKNRPFLVMDTGDIHYHRLKMKATLSQKEEDWKDYHLTKKVELFTYQFFDKIITVTENDKKVLLEDLLPASVKVIPDVYDECFDQAKRKKNVLMFIGQYRHHPNEDAVIYFAKEIFPHIVQKNKTIEFWIVGDGVTKEIKALESEHFIVKGFVPNAVEISNLATISVVPLRYGAGIKGKVIEAIACGLPVVSTSVGVEGKGLKHNEEVLIADTPQEFARQVLRLLEDRNLQNKLAENAKLAFKKNYSRDVMNEKLKEIFLEKKNLRKGSCEKSGLQGDSIQEWHEFAEIFMHNEKWVDARQCLDKVLKIDPNDILANYRLASLYKKEESWQEAEIIFRNLNERISDTSNYKAGVLFHLGEIYQRQNPLESKKYFERVLELNPNHELAKKYLNQV